MRKNMFDPHRLISETNARDQAIVIALDVKNQVIRLHEVGTAKGLFKLCKISKLAFAYQFIPGYQSIFAIGMVFPKGA